MSHITQAKPADGLPVIRDLRALRMACERIGSVELRIPSGTKILTRTRGGQLTTDVVFQATHEPVPATMRFKTYYANRPGTAAAVVSVKPGAGVGWEDAYEIGLLPDPLNEGCYIPTYDVFDNGKGLFNYVGEKVEDADKADNRAIGLLLMHYNIAVDELTARELGHEYSVVQMPDGSWQGQIVVPDRIAETPLLAAN